MSIHIVPQSCILQLSGPQCWIFPFPLDRGFREFSLTPCYGNRTHHSVERRLIGTRKQTNWPRCFTFSRLSPTQLGEHQLVSFRWSIRDSNSTVANRTNSAKGYWLHQSGMVHTPCRAANGLYNESRQTVVSPCRLHLPLLLSQGRKTLFYHPTLSIHLGCYLQCR